MKTTILMIISACGLLAQSHGPSFPPSPWCPPYCEWDHGNAGINGPSARLGGGGHSFTISSNRPIEAIYLGVDGLKPYTQWYVAYAPVVTPGKPAKFDVEMWDAENGERVNHPATAVHILSVAFSDDYRAMQPNLAQRLAQIRDDIRNGVRQLDMTGCDDCSVALTTLLMQYRHENPGRPVPQIKPVATPFVGYPWWAQGSMTVVGTVNGFLEPHYPDFAGNPQITGGCVGPCSVFTTATASCPPWMPPPPVRPQISSTVSGGSSCQNSDINIASYATYGAGGFGGSASQRYGVESSIELAGPLGGPFYGAQWDSCGLVGPVRSGNGGGGRCN